jgi:capping protein beta
VRRAAVNVGASRSLQGIAGTWDSIHVAEVTEGDKGTSRYKLTTTIILQCDTEAEGVKNNVGGYRMQVMEKDMKNDAENTHLVNIGTMVQDMENKMLSQMKEVYFGKTQETTKRLRYLDGGASRQAGAMLRQAFMEAAGDK